MALTYECTAMWLLGLVLHSTGDDLYMQRRSWMRAVVWSPFVSMSRVSIRLFAYSGVHLMRGRVRSFVDRDKAAPLAWSALVSGGLRSV